METPAEQPDQPTQDEETGDTSADPGGGTPTPATLPSDAREGDDEHEEETGVDEQSDES